MGLFYRFAQKSPHQVLRQSPTSLPTEAVQVVSICVRKLQKY